MRKFKIVTIAHQLKNQVIAKHGDLVNEDQLNNNASELVSQGFIVEVFEDVIVDQEEDGSIFSEMTKAELVLYANDNDIVINAMAKKDVIREVIEAFVNSKDK